MSQRVPSRSERQPTEGEKRLQLIHLVTDPTWNIQAVQKTSQQKINKSTEKWGQRTSQTLLKKSDAKGQQAYKKLLDTIALLMVM